MSHRPAATRARVSTVSREATDLERTFYGQLIGELALARRRRSMTQEDLDETLGVSRGLVAKWESFLRMPGSFMLVCWCNALDVDLAVAHRRLAPAIEPPPPPPDDLAALLPLVDGSRTQASPPFTPTKEDTSTP